MKSINGKCHVLYLRSMARDQPPGKQLGREKPGGSGRQEVEHKSAFEGKKKKGQ